MVKQEPKRKKSARLPFSVPERRKLRALLERGYFPKELPPPFNTQRFGRVMTRNVNRLPSTFDRAPRARLGTHLLARPGTLARSLGIPDPVHQFQVSREIAQHWEEIEAIVNGSPYSKSTPVFLSEGRAVGPAETFRSLPMARADNRAAASCILRTDVSQFYHALYTHSIPWAIHGKAIAKAKRGPSLVGNRIDMALRDSQDGQTAGIPVGPDTSFVIAEALLSKVDLEIQDRVTASGIRYIDDYEFAFSSRSDAEAALPAIRECTAEYELTLNPLKTEIVDLPLPLVPLWVLELRSHVIREDREGQRDDLFRIFNQAFDFARTYSRDSVLKYCLGLVQSAEMAEDNWQLVNSLSLQCIMVEPGTLPAVLNLLMKQVQQGVELDEERLSQVLNSIIVRQSGAGHDSEVAWAIWASILLRLPVFEESVRAVKRFANSVVALLVLHARELGILKNDDSFDNWRDVLTSEGLQSHWWLFSYEAALRGWLSAPDHDHLSDSEPFHFLQRHGVSFYDETAAGTTPKDIDFVRLLTVMVPEEYR